MSPIPSRLAALLLMIAPIVLPMDLPASEPTASHDIPASATLPVSEELGRVLEQIREEFGLPALAGATWTQGELREIAAVGVRRLGKDEPIQADSLVHIGSCTKAMTATMLARLVERGVLRWDITLSQAVPDLAEAMHPDYREVTLWNLLQHQSGLAENLHEDGLLERLYKWEGSTTSAREELVRVVFAQAPAAPPRTKEIYSNSGYVLAGLIAERATGKSWEQLMHEEVFKPLGMASVGFGPPGRKDNPDQPWGHRRGMFGKVTPLYLDNPTALGPAGTVHLSLADWAKFGALHAVGDVDYLSSATLEKLHDPGKGTFAAGWVVLERPWAGGKTLMHNGSNTMWYTTIWIAPARNAVFLVATNIADPKAFQACDKAVTALVLRAMRDNPSLSGQSR